MDNRKAHEGMSRNAKVHIGGCKGHCALGKERENTAFHSHEVVLCVCTRNPALCSEHVRLILGHAQRGLLLFTPASLTCNWSQWCAARLFIASQLCLGQG